MWPEWAHFEVASGLVEGCDSLQRDTGTKPAAVDRELIENLLARADSPQRDMVLSSVCHAAIVWKDLSLWLRAVKTCDAERSVSSLGIDNTREALNTFGLEGVQRRCVLADAS